MEIKGIKPKIRYLGDMKEVLFDKKWAEKKENLEVYYMYRGVEERDNIRYDIVIIPPRILGEKEFTKTKGHRHEGNFQELYYVLDGEALYLFQKGEEVVE
ncbi:glucose-6-phosphate isomerase, partial [bacterium]|nr:glucose-6-phosphate isomerase [bacterium]